MLIDTTQLRLSDRTDMQVTWDTIGNNHYPLLVVDNFYANPAYVAGLAHSLCYDDPKGHHINASTVIALSTDEIFQFVHDVYAQKWQIKRNQILGLENRWRFFRSALSGSGLPIRREDPHADGKFILAGLVYLTPDAYCRGGTGFYRHRETNAEEVPPSLEWLRQTKVPAGIIRTMQKYNVYDAFKASGKKDYDQFKSLIPSKNTGNRYHLAGSDEKWKLTKLVEMKYNRFIMYPAFVLHKAIYEEDWFDGPLTQRRLTQNFFFRFPKIDTTFFDFLKR